MCFRENNSINSNREIRWFHQKHFKTFNVERKEMNLKYWLFPMKSFIIYEFERWEIVSHSFPKCDHMSTTRSTFFILLRRILMNNLFSQLWSISPTFYAQLFPMLIQKVQKRLTIWLFFVLLGSVRAKAACRMLMNLTPALYILLALWWTLTTYSKRSAVVFLPMS